MYKVAAKILSFYLIYLLIFIVMKPIFMTVHQTLMGQISVYDWLGVIYHGIPMDCSVAGYFTIIPALIVIAYTITDNKITDLLLKVYIIVSSIIISTVGVLDIVLYGYWNFRLDATPIFYFLTSPSSAMASANMWQIILAIIIVVIFSAAINLLVSYSTRRIAIAHRRRWSDTICAIIFTAALIIPIRGSFSVSTMNLSRSYYSDNPRLNHAALNPIFSLMYSLTHQRDFGSQFRFFDENKAEEIVCNILPSQLGVSASAKPLLKVSRPDIYIIILESFSNHLMPSLGGESIAMGLDSIGKTGLLFKNFFASGARTDRAIPAILSAFPAQPTTSLMKFTEKIEHTPSLAAELKNKAGYKSRYYYGGDVNFTNMLAYLVSSSFDDIISDKDFRISQRTSKWGVHDGVLFSRVLNDLSNNSNDNRTPVLRVIQTSSSHEPFEVPYLNPRFADDERKNAFAYADSCITSFINRLYGSGHWNNSLVLITADHYGVYPRTLNDAIERHRVPLIVTGGALIAEPEIDDTYGDQTAIASTLLNILGLDAGFQKFVYSRNLFDKSVPQFAFFSEPGLAAYLDAKSSAVINIDNDAAITQSSGENPDSAAIKAKAILQTIYTKLSEL